MFGPLGGRQRRRRCARSDVPLVRGMADAEEALILAVIRLKQGDAALTVAQLHEALAKEGIEAAAAQVKKANSKATKRMATAAASAPAPEPQAAAATSSKKEQKAQKALADAMKAAEAHMMAAQTRMRDRWLADGVGKAPPSEGKMLVQYATTRALTGVLENKEVLSMERLAADVATLEWMLLPGMPLELPPEAHAEAARRLEGLRSALSGKSPLDRAAALYVSADAPDAQKVLGGGDVALADNASIDRVMRLAHNAEALRIAQGGANEGADPLEELD